MTPLPAAQAFDAYFHDARARLLDLAAFLDRVDRGDEVPKAEADPRWAKVREALAVLAGRAGGRAEAVQQVFSLGYDPDWRRPTPR